MKVLCPCCKEEKEVDDNIFFNMKSCQDCSKSYVFDNLVIPQEVVDKFINTRMALYVEREYFDGFVWFLNHFDLRWNVGSVVIKEESAFRDNEWIIISYNLGNHSGGLSYNKDRDFSLTCDYIDSVYDVVNHQYLR